MHAAPHVQQFMDLPVCKAISRLQATQMQGLTDVPVSVIAPLVGHEELPVFAEHEGVDGPAVVHGCQAGQLHRGHLLHLIQLAAFHHPWRRLHLDHLDKQRPNLIRSTQVRRT